MFVFMFLVIIKCLILVCFNVCLYLIIKVLIIVVWNVWVIFVLVCLLLLLLWIVSDVVVFKLLKLKFKLGLLVIGCGNIKCLGVFCLVSFVKCGFFG